jgi:hypothetical protein
MENGSSQGQNLALTGLFVPSSLVEENPLTLIYVKPRPDSGLDWLICSKLAP